MAKRTNKKPAAARAARKSGRLPDSKPTGEESFAAVRAGKLTDEVGATTASGIMSPWRVSVADRLSPSSLGAIMRDADQGLVEAYLTLAEEIEEREIQYATVLQTRKLAVSGLPVSVTSPDDSADGKAITEDVEKLFKRLEIEDLVKDLMDAVAKGFACVEIVWARDVRRWEPAALKFRPQRHFAFDRDTMEKPKLRTDANPTDGEPLAPYKWIVHMPRIRSGLPVRNGLARTAAFAYAAKRYTIADWLTFLDVYGMPIRIGRYSADMAARKRELLNAVRSLGSDAAAVIPKEMEIEIIETKAGTGATLFRESAEYWDSMFSKLVLGQTMTTDNGSSKAQGTVHENTARMIHKADARAVCATINKHLIRPFVDLNYGPREAYPEASIIVRDPQDERFMDHVKIFVGMGGKVQASEVRDRLGLSEPEDGADLLEPEAAITARSAPKPATGTNAPTTGGQGGANEGGTGEDDELEEDPTTGRVERNASAGTGETFERTQGTEDVVDDLERERLDGWRPLLDENVRKLIDRAQSAESYEELRAALDTLASDAGEELAIGLMTAQLARATFATRGVGDATDETEL